MSKKRIIRIDKKSVLIEQEDSLSISDIRTTCGILIYNFNDDGYAIGLHLVEPTAKKLEEKIKESVSKIIINSKTEAIVAGMSPKGYEYHNKMARKTYHHTIIEALNRLKIQDDQITTNFVQLNHSCEIEISLQKKSVRTKIQLI